MAGYKRPAWRGYGPDGKAGVVTAQAYVDALLDSDVLLAELNLLVDDHPDLEKWETKAWASRRRWLARALVSGVELARNMHEQIEYEAAEEGNAKKALEQIADLEQWIEGFNNPKFTMRYLAPRPQDRIEDIPPEMLEMLMADSGLGIDMELAHRSDDLNHINPDLVNSAFQHLKERAQWRIRIANKDKRLTLAGAKRQTGGLFSQDRDEAAARYGTGAMALSMIGFQKMVKASGWDDPNKLTTLRLQTLANIAHKLFDVKDPGYSPKNMEHYITTARQIERDRGEEGVWFGDA